ncbi:ZinT family metal-binding protein [Nitratireductor basaltis]|uniref:ZinT domain-containing protein n=1 Tax=Nitratireductor basaltis TaxID=472175 RepID=A0A084U777_9HYPH|nr:metal-binding protein ZinT [Nitratireductor basaltis]KFB08813.1 Hypothetical protein EL18_03067 [Nitratireductor basaltis]
MKNIIKIAAVTASLFVAAGTVQADGKKESHSEKHAHSHSHSTEAETKIYQGYFEDGQVQERTLADWEGEWQSVFPYLQDGTLDPVFAHKAENGDKSAEEYKAYYRKGYETDVDRIEIKGDHVTFSKSGASFSGTYAGDGYEILTYEKGNRGVRFIFKKTEGDDSAPDYIQFSDHIIAPKKADHYHLYWGDDRAELLKELSNWPTYYPAALTGEQIVKEMTAH